jgi:hypothetical protein
LWFVVCFILAAAVFVCWHCFRDEWLPLFVVCGCVLWFVVCSLLIVAYGLWICSLWFFFFCLWFVVWGLLLLVC